MSYNFRIKNFVIARYHSVSSKNNLHIGPHHQISQPKTPKDVNVTLSIYIHKYRIFQSFDMFLNPHMYLKSLSIV